MFFLTICSACNYARRAQRCPHHVHNSTFIHAHTPRTRATRTHTRHTRNTHARHARITHARRAQFNLPRRPTRTTESITTTRKCTPRTRRSQTGWKSFTSPTTKPNTTTPGDARKSSSRTALWRMYPLFYAPLLPLYISFSLFCGRARNLPLGWLFGSFFFFFFFLNKRDIPHWSRGEYISRRDHSEDCAADRRARYYFQRRPKGSLPLPLPSFLNYIF
jgi:hypothetical protein